MKARYPLAALMVLSAVLAYTGVRYQAKRRRAILTMQLVDAIQRCDQSRAIRFLQSGADPNAKGMYGRPLIFDAIDIYDTSLLSAFIAARANVNVEYSPQKGERLTLLSEVGQYGESLYPAQIEQMKMLLDAGANPNLGTESVLVANAGACTEACWCNPREIALLLKHGTKLRKGDAAAILQMALDCGGADGENGPRLLRLWATLPIPSQERRIGLGKAIKDFSESDEWSTNEKQRDKMLAFLRGELHKT